MSRNDDRQSGFDFETTASPVRPKQEESEIYNVISLASYSRSNRRAYDSNPVLDRLLKEAKRLRW
jgi:hypothetical protein